jgi:hypothetical protein
MVKVGAEKVEHYQLVMQPITGLRMAIAKVDDIVWFRRTRELAL